MCNNQVPHMTLYYQCSQGCRFSACSSCFEPSRRCVDDGWARPRCTSEPPRPADHVPHPNPTANYGRVQLTRYVHMPLAEFVQKVNSLIAEGQFAHLGIPQIRIEGTTAWGAWLRINHRHGAFGRRPQLLCGVLFHATNRTLTFHGDAVSASSLFPIFQEWTYEHSTSVPTTMSSPRCSEEGGKTRIIPP